jgi:hypothetical protein
MIKLLEEIDEMLAAMECTMHGAEGRAVTEMRGRIQTELSNSHKPVVVRGGASETKNVHRHKNDLKWDDFLDTPNTPTELLQGEAVEKGVRVGSKYNYFCVKRMHKEPVCLKQCEWCKKA